MLWTIAFIVIALWLLGFPTFREPSDSSHRHDHRNRPMDRNPTKQTRIELTSRLKDKRRDR